MAPSPSPVASHTSAAASKTTAANGMTSSSSTKASRSNSVLQSDKDQTLRRVPRDGTLRKCISTDISRYEKKFMLRAQETQLPDRPPKRIGAVTTSKIGEYVIVEKLGAGGDGNVYLGRKSRTLEKVAIKVIMKSQGRKNIKRARREYTILSSLNHEHVIKLIDVYENEKLLAIITEYAPGGDLFDYIAKCGKLDQREASRIFKQLVSAVGYLHAEGFIHRDIKPENVFLDDRLNVKLGDFGYASSWSSLKRRHRSCGSVMYASPEIVSPCGSYVGPEVDCWSLGACLFTMLTNQFPFDSTDTSVVRHKIATCAWRPPASFSFFITDLLDSLLELNPLKRATIGDIKKHPWMQGTDQRMLMGRRRSAPHIGLPPRPRNLPLLPSIIEE